LEQVPPRYAEVIFNSLEERAAAELAEEGLAERTAAFERELDMRYTGQGYELRVALAGIKKPLTQAGLAQARARFDETHARFHGHAAPERAVEIVSYRVRLRVRVPKYRQPAAASVKSRRAPKEALKGVRAACFDGASETKCKLYERGLLPPGSALEGPAIVEQFDATTVVPRGWSARVDAAANLVLRRGAHG
jgi:N-methylhydantoinase A